MALQDLLQLSAKRELADNRGNLSLERLEAIKPIARQYIAFWREYPDMFVDFLQTGRAGGEVPASGLRFYFYQRVFLRAAMRYKYVYMTFTRAYSKSFLSILTLMCRCILYPGAQLFVTSGGKEQSAGIMQEKVAQLCRMVPAFEKEIDRSRGKTKESKDYCKYIFKNGSSFDNIVARESARGLRRHGKP